MTSGLSAQGYVDAARTLEQESGTAPGVVLSTITDRMEIRKAVQSGQVEEAIDKVNDLNPEVNTQLSAPVQYHTACLGVSHANSCRRARTAWDHISSIHHLYTLFQ
eukprot:GHUV01048146.1.p1 GENE.GHUV01048146.1~~GHUV01048146.1.p1  ORF type:complete len:106 (-),score=16.59 GHUV01048146.1:66-383(-)